MRVRIPSVQLVMLLFMFSDKHSSQAHIMFKSRSVREFLHSIFLPSYFRCLWLLSWHVKAKALYPDTDGWSYTFLFCVQNPERCITVFAFQSIAPPHLGPAHGSGVTCGRPAV